VSILNPVTLARTAFVCKDASGCLTNPTNSTDLGTFQQQIILPGTGTSQIRVSCGGGSATLNLFGALAVDPATNQVFVAQSGSNQILIVNLGPTSSTTMKAAQITELQVKTVAGATTGGIPGALMSQRTLTS